MPGSGQFVLKDSVGGAAVRGFTGRVLELDAAWVQTQLAIQCLPGQAAWTGVLLGATSALAPGTPAGALVVLSGGQHVRDETLSLGAGKDWLLTDMADVRRVLIHSAGQVRLQRLPQLVAVHGHASSLSLQLDDVPALRQVTGQGDLINLRQPTSSTAHLAAHLEIAEGWKHARIHSQHLRSLHFPNGRSLALHDCGRLAEVKVPLDIEIECSGALAAPLIGLGRFHFNESSLNACIEQFHAGDTSQLDGILTVLASAHHRTKLAVTLQRLAALCGPNVAPARIWAARRELAARHLGRHSRKPHAQTQPTEAALQKADTRWHWDFAADLAPQGWEADLQIWRHCMHSVPAAAAYADTIVRAPEDEAGREALVRVAGSSQADAVLFQLAVAMLDHRLGHAGSTAPDGSGYGSAQRLGRLLGSVFTDAHARNVITSTLCETLPLHELVEAVPSLMHLAPGLFRSKLMALSAKPERWFRLSIRNETQAGGDLAAGSALSPASAADGARTLPAGHCHAPDDDRHHPHPYPHPPHGPGCRSALKCPVMTTTTATRRRPRCRRSSRTSSN